MGNGVTCDERKWWDTLWDMLGAMAYNRLDKPNRNVLREIISSKLKNEILPSGGNKVKVETELPSRIRNLFSPRK